jgi:hypothetical protein
MRSFSAAVKTRRLPGAGFGMLSTAAPTLAGVSSFFDSW